MRKLCSRTVDYSQEFKLQCLIYDIQIARSIMSLVPIADKQKLAPESLSTNSSPFSVHWERCALTLFGRCRVRGLPTAISPGGWSIPYHQALFARYGEGNNGAAGLTLAQGLLTLHFYHGLTTMLDSISKPGEFFEDVYDCCARIEFQDRGTLHMHVAAWRLLLPCYKPHDGKSSLSGRTGSGILSPVVKMCEDYFHGSADAQFDDLGANTMAYITGYATKASDFMQWNSRQYGRNLVDHKWLTTY